MNAPFVEATLESARLRIEAAVGSAAQRLIDTLGASGAGFQSPAQRQAQSNAQFELRRRLPNFKLVLTDALRALITEAAQPAKPASLSLAQADFESLALVDEDEVDERVSSDKLGAQVAQHCEAELQDLNGYLASLLQRPQPEPTRNPLRPELVARALRRAIHACSDDKDIRLTLEHEFSRQLPAALKPCYALLVADFQGLGLKPTTMMVRTVQGPGNELPREIHRESSGYQTSGYNTGAFQLSVRDIAQAEQVLNTLFGVALPPTHASLERRSATASDFRPSATGALGGVREPPGSAVVPSRHDRSSRQPLDAQASRRHDLQSAEVDSAQLLDVLRRLSRLDPQALAEPAPTFRSTRGSPPNTGARPSMSGALASAPSLAMPTTARPSQPGEVTPMAGLMAVNVIRQHREELMRASTGALDHMVIDVVAALFDQVLSDKKVPPAVARQIARLQLPVLRVALKDVSFFNSRRHPVRRFVNRIASLAAAYEDLEQGPGRQFVDRVQALVQEIVEGDFDQMDVYDAKLRDIEALIQDQSARDVGPQAPVASLIDAKATQLRIQQRYMRELTSQLQTVTLPDFVRDFIAQVWSQVQVRAADASTSTDFADRARNTARQLAMSLQPKGSLPLRKAFLMQLPQLMKDLNEGLGLIGWPEEAKREFFARLMPLHSEALKAAPLTDFAQRQLKHQLDQVDKVSIPTVADLQAGEGPQALAMPLQEAALSFSSEEAERIGLVDEATVDWNGQIDIDIADGQAASAANDAVVAGDTLPDAGDDGSSAEEIDIVLDALGPEAAAPTHGPQLVRHLQTGIAYRMHLEGRWQRVRLNWISPGRGFFVFTHGKAHEKTLSMTARMITRMCETERFRAYEQAELLERATARARKQLAKLGLAGELPGPTSSAPPAASRG